MKEKNIIHILIVIVCACFITCSPAVKTGKPIGTIQLNDGTYKGSSKGGANQVKVEVTIKNNKITEVDLVKHNAWKGHKADSIIPQRIVEKQSTDVDIVTGATNSSYVIMNAVQNAIEKASVTK